uniref:Uncharacterized protein n=1 Tax=Arundo donax TaxID=35708 RepID=A0A0A9HEI3_ARUDO
MNATMMMGSSLKGRSVSRGVGRARRPPTTKRVMFWNSASLPIRFEISFPSSVRLLPSNSIVVQPWCSKLPLSSARAKLISTDP